MNLSRMTSHELSVQFDFCPKICMCWKFQFHTAHRKVTLIVAYLRGYLSLNVALSLFHAKINMFSYLFFIKSLLIFVSDWHFQLVHTFNVEFEILFLFFFYEKKAKRFLLFCDVILEKVYSIFRTVVIEVVYFLSEFYLLRKERSCV